MVYPGQLIKIWDGDTIDFKISLGFGFFVNARIRLIGVDAPEIFKVKKDSEEFKAGMIALLVVREWCYNYTGPYNIAAESRDLYGRWLGEVWRADKEQSLNDYMKERFYKSPYFAWVHQEPLKEDYF